MDFLQENKKNVLVTYDFSYYLQRTGNVFFYCFQRNIHFFSYFLIGEIVVPAF